MNNYTAEFESVTGILSFVNGFANGTTIADTPNYTLCYNAIQGIVIAINETEYEFYANDTIYGWLVTAESFFSIFTYLYPINFSCYYGFIEAVENVATYGGTIANPFLLYTNVVYNFGLIYDAVKNMVLFFLGFPRPGYTTPGDVGFELGSAVFYLLFDSE